MSDEVEAQTGGRGLLAHDSLDAIISVGYRVNSKRGTQFRIHTDL
jgi:hypothetical protein